MAKDLNGILTSRNNGTTYIQLNKYYKYLRYAGDFNPLSGTKISRDNLVSEGWLLLAEEPLIKWSED